MSTMATASQTFGFLGDLMHLVFYLLALVFAIFTAFLVYHWYAYGTDRKISNLSLIIYLLGSLPFFLIMMLSLNSL